MKEEEDFYIHAPKYSFRFGFWVILCRVFPLGLSRFEMCSSPLSPPSVCHCVWQHSRRKMIKTFTAESLVCPRTDQEDGTRPRPVSHWHSADNFWHLSVAMFPPDEARYEENRPVYPACLCSTDHKAHLEWFSQLHLSFHRHGDEKMLSGFCILLDVGISLTETIFASV